MKLKSIVIGGVCIVLAMILYQCGTSSKTAKTKPKVSVVAIAHKRWPDATIESLKAGQAIYNTKCTKCHDAKEISDYSEDDWLPLIDQMSRKAHLTDDDKETVKRYILTEREYLAQAQ